MPVKDALPLQETMPYQVGMRGLCSVLLLGVLATTVHGGQPFIRGDVDSNGTSFLSDMVWLTSYLYSGGPAPLVQDAGDVNDNGLVEISDIVYLLRFGFLGGSMPPAPFPFPGTDPTPNNFAPPLDPDVSLSLASTVAIAGQVGIELPLTLSTDKPVEAIELALAFDPAAVTVESIVFAGGILGPSGTEYIAHGISNDPLEPYAWMAAVVDFATPIDGHALPVGADQLIATVVISIPDLASAPQVAGLAFTAGLALPPKQPLVSVNGGEARVPATVDSVVEIAIAFIRGDVNRDEVLDVSDAIYAIAYFFNDGPTPPCLDSADCNNDGVLNIADPIYLLNYLFSSGPTPSAPFPFPGLDLDNDVLDCQG